MIVVRDNHIANRRYEVGLGLPQQAQPKNSLKFFLQMGEF
jgi:hypothetical protein